MNIRDLEIGTRITGDATQAIAEKYGIRKAHINKSKVDWIRDISQYGVFTITADESGVITLETDDIAKGLHVAFQPLELKVTYLNGQRFISVTLDMLYDEVTELDFLCRKRSLARNQQRATSSQKVVEIENNMAAVTNYKFKFEALVEHCKKQDREIADMRYDLNVCRLYSEGNVWFWQGDGTDSLPTIACPIVINAGDLRSLINSSSAQPLEI